MYYLAICIPNYNRLYELERLINKSAQMIVQNKLEQEVEICINDDCSPENPEELIRTLKRRFPKVCIRYEQNRNNMGMDYNFLQSVLIADSKYCWIVGNDDVPTDDSLNKVIHQLKAQKDQVDIMITPFDVYDPNDNIRTTIYPLRKSSKIVQFYNTENRNEFERLIFNIQHNSGLFGFLSNTIFKREKWIHYQDKFQDKFNTIFIQMYMNIQSLVDGAILEYFPEKIIKNYADDKVNESLERIGKVLLGLNDVIEFFFEGESKKYLLEVIVDNYINATVWELPEEDMLKKKVIKIASEKNEFYKKYFVPKSDRKKFFKTNDVILFGAGDFGRKALDELVAYKANVVAVIDSDPMKKGMMLGKYCIESRNLLKSIYVSERHFVVVANNIHLKEMIKGLLDEGIGNIAIIT